MVKLTLTKEEYAPTKDAGLGNYYVRVLPKWSEDGNSVDCVEDMVYGHEPTDADRQDIENRWLAKRKQEVKAEITAYDNSAEIKHFTIGEVVGWFDDAKRSTIKNSVTAEKEAGRETSLIQVSGVSFNYPCTTALAMIRDLELYSKDCFAKTSEHKTAVDALTTVDDVDAYDYKTGYPTPLDFEEP